MNFMSQQCIMNPWTNTSVSNAADVKGFFFLWKQVWVLRPCLWEIGLLRWCAMQKAGLLSLWNLLLFPCWIPAVFVDWGPVRHPLLQIGLSFHLLICIWKESCWIEIDPMGLHNGHLAFDAFSSSPLSAHFIYKGYDPSALFLWRPDVPFSCLFIQIGFMFSYD